MSYRGRSKKRSRNLVATASLVLGLVSICGAACISDPRRSSPHNRSTSAGPGVAGSPKSPPQSIRVDHSTAYGTGGGFAKIRFAKIRQGLQTLQGKVETIRLPPGDIGYQVIIAGPKPVTQRTLLVDLPPKIPLPFRVGQNIVVKVDLERLGRRVIGMASISDLRGRLLLATSNSSDTSLAPGWHLIKGEALPYKKPRPNEDAVGVYHTMALQWSGRTARIAPGQWRQLVTPHGIWWVTAISRNISLEGIPPKDAHSYRRYSIVRRQP